MANKAFSGFNEKQMGRIAEKLGYQGPMHKFGEFLQSNPASNQKYMGLYNKAKMKMAQGGAVPDFGQITTMAVGEEDDRASVITDAIGEDQPGFKGPDSTMAIGEDNRTAEVPEFGKGITTQMIGEEGGYNPFTMEVGENGIQPVQRPTGVTRAVGEDGNPNPFSATQAVGEQPGDPVPNLGAFQPITRAVGENADGSFSGLGYAQPITAAVGETPNNMMPEAQPTTTQRPVVGTDAQGNPIYQTSEGVGAPTIGAATPIQQPYGPIVDAEGNPQQIQVLDVEGNPVLDADGNPTYRTAFPTIGDISVNRMFQPGLPTGGVQVAQGIDTTSEQMVASGAGSVGTAPQVTGTDVGATAQATAPETPTAKTYTAQEAANIATTTAAAGMVGRDAQVQAATQNPSTTEVANVGPAQLGQAQQIEPAVRTLSAEELVQAPANAEFAAQFAEEVKAAEAQPTEQATVQGQLANMMAQFEDGQTPPWAAGAMRNATAIMAQRGLGASSMAGQAIIQAAMESALPIAMQDAQTVSQFEQMNLSNRQQRAMLAAQQRAQFIGQEFDQEFQARVANASRISDIANMNFNAEQQVALENAQLAQTVDLANLSNRQATQMAEIAQIAQLEMTNLNNRQQAAVQNAQSFLQMDMANLSNEQQATMFDAQSRVQKLFSDQAAENAARQFNASSQNQVDQYFANLKTQVSQFNATQSNAMEQFSVEEKNAIEKFNTEVKNQRDQFNAQNELVIAQSNAQWRRDVATANTAAINIANQNNAQAVLDISEQAYANLWQAFEDQMEYAWQSAEKREDRINAIVRAKISADATLKAEDIRADAAASTSLGKFATYALFGSGGLLG